MNKPVQELTQLVSEFPGIGPRQARRIVQFLLSKDGSYRDTLAQQIKEIRERTAECTVCFRFDEARTNGTCTLCADTERDKTMLMVVEKDVDIESIESSSAYRGQYFVLGGLIPLTERKRMPTVRTKELIRRIEKNGIQEVIFALSTTPEGDYTARELSKELTGRNPALRATILGRGLSVGAEIEYADSETLRNALKNRS